MMTLRFIRRKDYILYILFNKNANNKYEMKQLSLIVIKTQIKNNILLYIYYFWLLENSKLYYENCNGKYMKYE